MPRRRHEHTSAHRLADVVADIREFVPGKALRIVQRPGGTAITPTLHADVTEVVHDRPEPPPPESNE